MRQVLGIVLFAVAAQAAELPPHMMKTWGGWLECSPGYVMRDARECVTAEEIRAQSFEISSLPSAGDGAPTSCPSGGCDEPAPRVAYRDRPRYRSEWGYEGRNPGGGATFVRSVGGGRQVLIVPTWPW